MTVEDNQLTVSHDHLDVMLPKVKDCNKYVGLVHVLDRIIHISHFELISSISVFVCCTPAQLFYLPVKDSHD